MHAGLPNMKAILILAIAVALAAATPVPWTNCGSSTDLLDVKLLDVTPFPPVKGKAITATFAGILKEAIQAGTYNLKVNWCVHASQS